MKENRKYYPLYEYLLAQSQETTCELPFTEVEDILKATLPPSARKTRAWWANTLTTQSEAWLSAEWVVDYVNFPAGLVVFRPKRISYRITPVQRRPGWSPDQVKALREHTGWTQQELADQMGVRQQTISEWETGLHTPHFSTSKHLSLVAKEVNFPYQVEE